MRGGPPAGSISVISHAPPSEPKNPAVAAGSKADQRKSTRRAYWLVATAVPQIDAPLLMPNSVAGGVVGKTVNKAGTRISPPPPTMASTKPASSEAKDTSSNSMTAIVALDDPHFCYVIYSC